MREAAERPVRAGSRSGARAHSDASSSLRLRFHEEMPIREIARLWASTPPRFTMSTPGPGKSSERLCEEASLATPRGSPRRSIASVSSSSFCSTSRIEAIDLVDGLEVVGRHDPGRPCPSAKIGGSAPNTQGGAGESPSFGGLSRISSAALSAKWCLD